MLFCIFVLIFSIMPVNKNALLRYRTIDNCLRNTGRRWTLEDLIDACSDALYEYTGKDDLVSRRTVQLDIQKMRSSELGYEAPIEVYDHKYYRYSDPDFSITDTPLSQQDMEQMADAVAVLKQLSGFSAFSGMEDIVGRLEDHLSAVRHEKEPVIYYEKNDSLKGLHFIPLLYEAVSGRKPVVIRYQSFKAKDAHDFVFSPYVLKEYRNRWFVFGRRTGERTLLNLALDRIISISEAGSDEPFRDDPSFDPKTYFDDIVGVSKGPRDRKSVVKFHVSPEQVPYVTTKPIHHSQQIIQRNDDGSAVMQIEVVLNYEIEKEFISFGEGIKVIYPRILVRHIGNRLKAAAEQYDDWSPVTGKG